MNTHYGKKMHFLDIFINNGRICVGFVTDNFSSKNPFKVIEDQIIF